MGESLHLRVRREVLQGTGTEKARKRLNSMGWGAGFFSSCDPLHCLGCCKIANVAETFQRCESQRENTQLWSRAKQRVREREKTKKTPKSEKSQPDRCGSTHAAWRHRDSPTDNARGRQGDRQEAQSHPQAFLLLVFPPIQVGPVYSHLSAPTLNSNYMCFLPFIPLLNY